MKLGVLASATIKKCGNDLAQKWSQNKFQKFDMFFGVITGWGKLCVLILRFESKKNKK
jgi:hypothetical protein